MSTRYEFIPPNGAYATEDEIHSFEDAQPGEVYFVMGDAGATAAVLTGTDRDDIVRQLEALLAEARTGVIIPLTEDPQDPLFGFDNGHRVTQEFLYTDGESWITVEEHVHEYEDEPVPGSEVYVCTECPASRLKEDLPDGR